MFYIVEIRYVGPNPDEHVDEDRVEVWTEPARTNSSGEVRTEGWCGTTNDWATTAHGGYSTLELARAAIAEKFGEVRLQEFSSPYDNDENTIEVYRFGRYEPLGKEATWCWIAAGLQSDIRADTTDERIEELVAGYETAANGEGFALSDRLQDMLKDHRRVLQDEAEHGDQDRVEGDQTAWSVSPAALALHDAAYEIGAAWENSRPVTRDMCRDYHAAVDRLLADAGAPIEALAHQLTKLKGWRNAGIIPPDGQSWAQVVIDAMEKQLAAIDAQQA